MDTGVGLAALFVYFVAMLAMLASGRWMARKRVRSGADAAPGVGVADGAVLALVGLLIAFTFSSAYSRFEQRRAWIVDEANAIGTAWLRLDLLAPGPRDALREDFRRYLDARLAGYGALPDERAAKAQLDSATGMQPGMWARAVAASEGSQSARMLLLPALNEMFDIATTRTAATLDHPPGAVITLLIVLPLLGSLLAGYGMVGLDRSTRLHAIVFAAATAVAVYVILELEFPRSGLIAVSDFDQVLIDLRRTMK